MLTFKQFNNVSVLSKNGSNGNRKRNVFSMFYTIFDLIQRRLEVVSPTIVVSLIVRLFQKRREK